MRASPDAMMSLILKARLHRISEMFSTDQMVIRGAKDGILVQKALLETYWHLFGTHRASKKHPLATKGVRK